MDIHCTDNCSYNGICKFENSLPKCLCSDGYTGSKCEIKVLKKINENKNCNASCKNGICLEKEDRCLCNEGFTGLNCDYETCINDCNGNGICKNKKCECFKGFIKSDCSERHMQVLVLKLHCPLFEQFSLHDLYWQYSPS